MSSIVRGFFSRRAACAVGLVALLAAAPTRAEVMFSNPAPSIINSQNTVNGPVQWATGFTTSAAALPLVSVDLSFGVPSGSVTPTVQLFGSSSGTAPTGSALATLTSLSTVTGAGPTSYTFTPTSPFNLAANTNYYVVVSAPGSPFGWFQSSAAPTAQNGSGWTALPGVVSTNGGSTYSSTLGSQASYISVVPEPSTLALAGIGMAALAGIEISRRSRRTASSRN